MDWVNEKRRGRAKYQVCLVVGLLICEDVVVAESDEEVRAFEARGVEPLGTIIDTPLLAKESQYLRVERAM